MLKIIKAPDLGDGLTEGTASHIPISAGQHIMAEETVLEVETDKVVVEIPSTICGEVSEILVKVGDIIQAGMDLVSIRPDMAAGQNDSSNPIPSMPGQASQISDLPITTNDSKLAEPRNQVQSDNFMGEITESDGQRTENTDSADNIPLSSLEPMPSNPRDIVRTGPSSRRLARQLGVDLARITGSGRKGRIIVDDITAYVKARLESVAIEASARPRQNESLPNIGAFGPIRTEILPKITSTMAQNMQRAWSQIPHAWAEQIADITELEAARKRAKLASEEQAKTLTLTAITCKALAHTLKRYPRFNACFDAAAQSMIYRDYFNIGVAVDTDRGLMVPVIRQVDKKSIFQIADDLSEVSRKARDGKLSPQDFKGAGMTISNLGSLGVTGLKPVVNWPEVALLGIASAGWAPLVTGPDDDVISRLLMPMTLAFDHRIINGADAARFLSELKRLVEDPSNFCL